MEQELNKHIIINYFEHSSHSVNLGKKSDVLIFSNFLKQTHKCVSQYFDILKPTPVISGLSHPFLGIGPLALDLGKFAAFRPELGKFK